jgi:ribosomal protein S18 acetylase RimI-like enzyme
VIAETLIRPGRASDAVRLQAIARVAYAGYISRIGREPAPMSADYSAAIAAGHAVVAEQGDLVIGYLIGYADGEAYFVENIAVDPQCQGSGIGGALLRHAIGEARRLNLPSIRLFTNAAMSENRSLYAHFGFVEMHRALEHGFDRVYMRLAL